MSPRRIDDAERRARLGARHHLARSARVADPVELAADLVGLHGSDPATVFLSTMVRMRTSGRAVPALERALYDDRTTLRLPQPASSRDPARTRRWSASSAS